MKPTHVVVHCSASEWGTILDINRWHLERGWKNGCGYHAGILNGYVTAEDAEKRRRDPLLNGALQAGRSLDMDAELEAQEVGAHAVGWNNRSLAVVLIGNGVYTAAQIETLDRLVRSWCVRFGIAAENVIGHNEIPGVAKACPALDMNLLRKRIAA
jgi:N-acetylmuramoyl-L-alanine amidase